MNDSESSHDDDHLRWLREALRDDVGEQSTAADVERLLAGHIPPEEALGLAARALDDPDLALQIRLANAIRTARDDEASRNDNVVTIDDRRWRRGLIAAVVAVAAGLLVFLVLRPPTLQDAGTPDLRAGVQPIAALNGVAAIPRDAFVLEWTAGPHAATYDLYVTAQNLEPVHQALDLTEPKYTVPASALSKFEAGARLLWRVTLVTAEGRRINSPAFEAEIE